MPETEKRKIIRVDGDNRSESDDLLISERRVRLLLDGLEFARTVMTPGNEEYWALGRLLISGAIASIGDVEHLSLEDGGATVGVERSGQLSRRAARESGVRVDFSQISQASQVTRSIRDGIRWLAEAPLYQTTGAAHVSALVRPDGTRLARMEDAGRHNAADKVIGWALANGVCLPETILLTSGRLAEDMVEKAAGAGIPVMASISAATAQGAALAARRRVTLIGFVRGERMNIYTVGRP